MTYDPAQPNLLQLCKEYAEGTRRMVFFVGAGGSAEVGMPTWATLRTRLLRRVSLEVDSQTASEDEMENFRSLEELSEADDRFWEFFACASRNWPTTYDDFMVTEFDEKVEDVDIPEVYKKIWSMLRVKQVFTLNVDNLVKRAFNEVYASRRDYQLLEFDGYSVTDSFRYISRDNYCLINLHGTYLQKSKWIMDAEQRRQLLSGSQGDKYGAYVSRLFSEYNVVFVGLNPADIAVSPFLRKAAELSMMGRHYWICPSPTSETRGWAQKNGVRLISYTPAKNESGVPVHSQDVCSILNDIEAFTSEDKRIELPVRASPFSPSDLGGQEHMATELMRDRKGAQEKLAGAITHIGQIHGFSSRELSQFLREYKIPLQIASMLDVSMDGFNRVGPYVVVDRIHTGGVSGVWTVKNVEDEDETYRALKSLSPDKLDDVAIRQSFRRGIESLYLLNSSNVTVAPKYIDHSELPLSVVMDFVSGATLSDLLSQHKKIPAKEVLGIFQRICSAVRSCHQSDGQVLHRDIKPGNILLEGWHRGYGLQDAVSANVRLINFDLSWHRFTSGDTKSIGADDIGYYAPEQRYSSNSLPPRSAETDVYMLGMVLFFLASGEAPRDGGAALSDWDRQVATALRANFKNTLLRNRVFRLILDMTRKEMAERIDLNSVLAELDAMSQWLRKSYEGIDDDYIVEAIAVETGRDYVWSRDSLSAHISATESIDFRISYSQRGRKVILDYRRQQTGSDQRRGFGARLGQKISSAGSILQDAGWSVIRQDNKGLSAEWRVAEAAKHPRFGGDAIRKVADLLLASLS